MTPERQKEILSRLAAFDVLYIDLGRILKCHPKEVTKRIEKLTGQMKESAARIDQFEREYPMEHCQ